MESTMKRLNHPSICRKVACLAVVAMFLVAATPLPATESELKAKPDETGTTKTEATAEPAPAETVDENATAICIDADAGQSSSVNTLEDIYASARSNLAALLTQTAGLSAEATPAVEEVRWTEVANVANVANRDESKTESKTVKAKVD